MANYGEYQYLDIRVEDGIALVEMRHPLYTMDGHYELNKIWSDLDRDREVRSVLYTWADPPRDDVSGPHFPDDMGPEARSQDPAKWWSAWQWPIRETREGIRDLLDSNKLVVSALRGEVPHGASLIHATLADVSIASTTATICDRHLDSGIVCGDGAVYWALACGVQKAKYLALTSAEISGAEAERIGLVTLALPDDQVMDRAWELARRFANGPQHAQNYTKRAFNQLHRLSGLLGMEVGQAYEVMNLVADPDAEQIGEYFDELEEGGTGERSKPYPSALNPYGPRGSAS